MNKNPLPGAAACCASAAAALRRRLSSSARPQARLALAVALLGAGSASAQSALTWGIEEKVSRGCVHEVSLAFETAGVLGGHPPQALCGSTAVRMYPEPLPTGTLSVNLRTLSGEPRRYTIPLDTVFRRENVQMKHSVLQLVYGQDSIEVWVRPLAVSSGVAAWTTPVPDAGQASKRIFFGGIELDAAPLPPGISRSR